MRTHIGKWGNSLALRLPRRLMEKARLKEGEEVEIALEGKTITIRPARPVCNLDDLLKGEPALRDGRRETDWGAPQGREVW